MKLWLDYLWMLVLAFAAILILHASSVHTSFSLSQVEYKLMMKLVYLSYFQHISFNPIEYLIGIIIDGFKFPSDLDIRK